MAPQSFAISDTRKIEDAMQHSPHTLPAVLTGLLQHGSRAEYAIATLSDKSFAEFVTRMEQQFPSTAREFLPSITSSILSKIASTVVEMVEDVDLRMGVSTRTFREGWNRVILGQPALAEIARLSSNMVWIAADVSVKPFVDLGIKVPCTRSDGLVAERDILGGQRRVLKAVRYLEKQQSPHDPEVEPWDAGSQATRDQVVAVDLNPNTRGSEAEPEADDTGTAYDLSTPKAAFYVENVKGFGEWKINVTDNANTEFRKLRKRSPETLRLVLKKVKDLSRGHFSSDNQILISDPENAVPIFKANVAGDTRLVYQVDCVTDAVTGLWRTALRLFGVYNHAELGRMGNFWDALGRDLGRRGKKYRDHCRARSQPRNTGNDVFSPITFSDSEQPSERSKPLALAENLEDLDYSMILSMHRFVGFSKALLNSFIADRDIAFMFEPSPMETEIIEHPHSCYVIGRSGTGKTLTMMYKIVSIEWGWSSSSWGLSKPRQLFVTRSRMLAGEVQRTTDQLIESFRLAELNQEELVYLRRRQDEQEERRRPLPKKWSQLEDDHFPLFIGFDKLRDLLEADFADSIRLLFAPVNDDDAGVEHDDGETGLVSGTRFIKAYWDHLPQSLTKGLDPASVFAEIMGVIQGSEETIDTPRGYLTRESYLELSTRSQPTFASMRGRIYDVFERYLLLKRRRREHDDAERTHRLLAVMATHRLPGHPVQFLYNDEAQDNLIVDMLCIIVHDEASREALFARGVLGGLILTVFQSKGLEFNDVFLWNFFENSELDGREWDIVCELFNNPMRSRDSMDKYHNLKSLYVAMTRARNNLFIIEESNHQNPVLNLWKARGQIEVQDGSTYSFKLSNLQSLPEDWARRGRALMDKQQYEQAKYCFDKAGLSLESDIAQAYLQQEAAITAEDFEDTARRFESCAEIPDRTRSKELLLTSAVCYSRAGNYPKSAQLYHDAFEYTKCVLQYIKASMMPKALHVTREHREDIDAIVVKKVCVHFLDLGQHKRVADLFPDPDECIQFMKSHDLTTHLGTYLEYLERFDEAAEIHLVLGRIPRAITLFLRDQNPSSIARGTTTLLDELWRRRTLGQPENKSSKLSSKLVDLLSHRQTLFGGVQYEDYERHEDEIRMFSFIISRKLEELLQLGIQLSSGGPGHTDSALLSLDYAFTFLLESVVQPSTLIDSSTFFPAFCAYSTLLKSHCNDPRSSKALDDAVWKERNSWMSLLSSCFHIPFFALGTPLMFHSQLIPEFSDACRVLRAWITDVLYVAFGNRGPAHWISSAEARTHLIPRSALLGYMLDNLQEAPQTTSTSVSLNLWYGPAYSHHLQQLRGFVNEPSSFSIPGALLYLRFLLEGPHPRGEGREAIIAHMAEGLSTAFILAKPVPDDRTLHNIILVRGWLVNLVGLWNSRRDPPSHDQTHIDNFIKLLRPMLRTLCASPVGVIKAFVLRKSESSNNLFLGSDDCVFDTVGHWLNLPEKGRLSIISHIADLPERCRPRYLQWSDWDNLKEAIWCCNTPSSTSGEQLIHVQKRGLRDTRPMDTLGSVIRIVYNMLDTLPSLLSVQHPPRQPAPFPSEWLLPKPHPVVGERKGVVRLAAAPCFHGQLRPVVI
ncbi:hypothetical protein LXA43DRAFT_899902 [Ganoderma leucocontextum]|nr:hypothetical protein LXA43DRAFT_899902 [Ganoderma leucocontextum]